MVINTNSPCMCNINRKYLAIRMLNKWMAAQWRPWSIWYIISGGRKSNRNNFTIIYTNPIESKLPSSSLRSILSIPPGFARYQQWEGCERDSDADPGEISIPRAVTTPMMNTPDISLFSILFTFNTKGSTHTWCPTMAKKARASAPAIAAVQSATHFPIVKWPRTGIVWESSGWPLEGKQLTV